MLPILVATYSIEKQNLLDFMIDPAFSIVNLKEYIENDKQLVRVEFKRSANSTEGHGAFVLSRTDQWTLQSYKLTIHSDDRVLNQIRATIEYADAHSPTFPTRMTRTLLVGGETQHEIEIEIDP